MYETKNVENQINNLAKTLIKEFELKIDIVMMWETSACGFSKQTDADVRAVAWFVVLCVNVRKSSMLDRDVKTRVRFETRQRISEQSSSSGSEYFG